MAETIVVKLGGEVVNGPQMAPLARDLGAQIGRASCRERVCT